MKVFLKSTVLILIILVVSIVFISPQASAVKKSKKSAMSEEDLNKVKTSVNRLYKKVYSSSLFAPTDNDDLFEDKIIIDSQLNEESPDAAFAELVYKLAFVLKEREFKDDAINYYQSLMDKFPDSAYVPKAAVELRKLGVTIGGDSEEEAE